VTGDPFDKPINIGPNNVIVAIGDQPKLVKHIARQFVIIDFVSGTITIPLGIFEIHGIMMGISWLLLFPTGFMVIRFYPKSKRTNPRIIHMTIQITGMATVLSAAALGATNVIDQFNSVHGMIGFVISALCIFQVTFMLKV
jgi:hypothetical protein